MSQDEGLGRAVHPTLQGGVVLLNVKLLPMKSMFNFYPRWKEELVCETPWASFTVEMTMGISHIYFPDETKWKRDLPGHLHDKWAETVGELCRWSDSQRIPVSLGSDAWIQLHENKNDA